MKMTVNIPSENFLNGKGKAVVKVHALHATGGRKKCKPGGIRRHAFKYHLKETSFDWLHSPFAHLLGKNM